jgi:hypothetical protein
MHTISIYGLSSPHNDRFLRPGVVRIQLQSQVKVADRSHLGDPKWCFFSWENCGFSWENHLEMWFFMGQIIYKFGVLMGKSGVYLCFNRTKIIIK